MNLISRSKNGFIFLILILSLSSSEISGKSIQGASVESIFEKLDLKGDPHHEEKETPNHYESEPSYESHHPEPHHDDPYEHPYEPEEEGILVVFPKVIIF